MPCRAAHGGPRRSGYLGYNLAKSHRQGSLRLSETGELYTISIWSHNQPHCTLLVSFLENIKTIYPDSNPMELQRRQVCSYIDRNRILNSGRLWRPLPIFQDKPLQYPHFAFLLLLFNISRHCKVQFLEMWLC